MKEKKSLKELKPKKRKCLWKLSKSSTKVSRQKATIQNKGDNASAV